MRLFKKRLHDAISPLLVLSLLAMAALPLKIGQQDTGPAQESVWYSPVIAGAVSPSLLDRRTNPNSFGGTVKEAPIPGQVSCEFTGKFSFYRTDNNPCLSDRAFGAAVLVRAPPCLH